MPEVFFKTETLTIYHKTLIKKHLTMCLLLHQNISGYRNKHKYLQLKAATMKMSAI